MQGDQLSRFVQHWEISPNVGILVLKAEYSSANCKLPSFHGIEGIPEIQDFC